MKKVIILFLLLTPRLLSAQAIANLPLWDSPQMSESTDWLVSKPTSKAKLYRTEQGYLVFSNGLVSRTFTITPNGATVGVERLTSHESFLRGVRSEAEITLNGVTLQVGGLTGQPIQNYLLPEWIPSMHADSASFKLVDFLLRDVQQRFPWKRRGEWITSDSPWPLPGKELIFRYAADQGMIDYLKGKKPELNPDILRSIAIEVHYELYDGMPLFGKWIKVINKGKEAVLLNRFKSERLAVTEPTSAVDAKQRWDLPNITLETDYNFGGMSDESLVHSSVAWNTDSLYETQVNYERTTPCLLEAYPKYGPGQVIASGGFFESFRLWELLHDSWERERKTLEHRRMMRALAPWSNENPILMHVSGSKDDEVKKAIDQCAEVGFEMVIMTFGSGYDVENKSPENIARMKQLADYAHTRHIALGGYSLLASRSINKKEDVVMPTGMTPRFGNSPCLDSDWGIDYFQKLYDFYSQTGLDVLEHDGSYPGDICASTVHPGHHGLEDSQWSQYQRIAKFYQWCRGKGIYLNVPDYYFLIGSSKTGMGYRETNWSLPREHQEIIERQNIYDGTWDKTPSMGWMFVPLVNYHGGGKAATIEPLKEHLPHYGQRLANLFGAGVQACYRGPQLYDAPETKALVAQWVTFYKKHRRILDSDLIHIRRPDGQDYDAILHVDPFGTEKGLLMIYNPLNSPITRKIKIPVYYTGLRGKIVVQEKENLAKAYPCTPIVDGRESTIELSVTLPAKGYNYFIFK